MKTKIYFLISLFFIGLFTQSIHCQEACDFGNDTVHCEKEHCQENMRYSFRYFTAGVGPIIFIPNVGLGYRQRHTQFGWDSALSFSTLGYAHQLSLHFAGHYYLNAHKQNSAYFGLGVIGSNIFTNHSESGCGTLSPDFIFGKELERNDGHHHFVEMHVAAPTMCFNSKRHDSFYLPLMYIKYGIGF